MRTPSSYHSISFSTIFLWHSAVLINLSSLGSVDAYIHQEFHSHFPKQESFHLFSTTAKKRKACTNRQPNFVHDKKARQRIGYNGKVIVLIWWCWYCCCCWHIVFAAKTNSRDFGKFVSVTWRCLCRLHRWIKSPLSVGLGIWMRRLCVSICVYM